MSALLRYVWFSKMCLTGWSTWKACYGDNSNSFICFLSSSYFFVLVFATLVSWKSFRLPRKVDGLEEEYLKRLEEGFAFQEEKTREE